jgi:WD40 repeat protein
VGTTVRPGERGKQEWSLAKIAFAVAVITLVFAVIAAVALPWHSSSTPAATAARQPASSPGLRIPVSPALRLRDPKSTGVYGIAYSRGGTLTVGDLNGSAYLWDVARAKIMRTFPDSDGEGIFGIALSPDGTTLAADTVNGARYTKGSLVLWNTSSDKPAAILTVPDGRGFGNPPAFSPDGSILAAAAANGSIYLWNTATGKADGTLTDPASQVDFGVAFSPATGFLAAADGNGTTFLWDTKKASIVRTFLDPGSMGVRGVAFSPDGGTLATGDNNGNVYLWNAATGAPMATLYGPKGGSVQSIAFSPHSGIVAATSDNHSNHEYFTCVWDNTGKLLALFQDPDSLGVTRVAFSPDGSTLAVGDQNASTYIWNMTWRSS